jgi:hypothetical protein
MNRFHRVQEWSLFWAVLRKPGLALLFDSLQMLFVLLPLRQRMVQLLPNFIEQRKLFQILGVER